MDTQDEKPRLILGDQYMSQKFTSRPTVLDEVWSLKNFKKKFRIVVTRIDDKEKEMEFDLIGIHPFLANTFRRIMISEVPSMAIEKVVITNNTSVIQDEVLAHTLGLIPLRANPKLFDFAKSDSLEDFTEQNSLEFQLKIRCKHNSEGAGKSSRVEDKFVNSLVYSKHIEWIPIGNQNQTLTAKDVGPVHDDIKIAVLRFGHEIDAKLIAVKGIGKDHAKFQPAVMAAYRMLPDIKLTRDVEGEDAEKLQKSFSPGVIDVLEEDGRKYAVVKNARYDTGSRNVFRHESLKDAVVMSRIQDHFIFTIESVGAWQPDDIFREALMILRNKCITLLEELQS